MPTDARTFSVPSFYLTGRQRLHPAIILLAIVTAAGAVGAAVYAMGHTRHVHLQAGGSDSGRSGGGASGAPSDADDDDDPNQIDTIVLGSPADAPVPGKRPGHVSPVHPTIVIRLPRYGDQVGKIPDIPSGHLLYDWLAAFNQASFSGLMNAVPTAAPAESAAAQMQLRKITGGFNLLSAKEVQPGVLVFRMSDQTPESTEVLGTLWVRPGSSPAVIQSFSLRAVEASPAKATTSH